jgi:hypothetical protein
MPRRGEKKWGGEKKQKDEFGVRRQIRRQKWKVMRLETGG